MEILKGVKKEEKKNTLKYRLKNKNLRICWICWKWNDWIVMKKSEAELLKKNLHIQEMCVTCKEWLSSWVQMICKWVNVHTKELCNSFYVLDLEMIKKYVPDAELGSSFEVWWCPRCSCDKKIHLTRESINEAYNLINKDD